MKRMKSLAMAGTALVIVAPVLAQQPVTRPAPQPPRPSPQPVRPAPQPPRPSPQPVRPSPQPSPQPVRPSPQPVRPTPQPVRPSPQPVRPPPQPGRPEVQPPRPGGGHRPAPPNYRPGYWNNQRYYYPHGYNYRRWSIGLYLPSAYWGHRYWWVNDWQLWGLPSYHPGYRWIRVGPDAILVSTVNGRIVAIRHNIFW